MDSFAARFRVRDDYRLAETLRERLAIVLVLGGLERELALRSTSNFFPRQSAFQEFEHNPSFLPDKTITHYFMLCN
jgi:hypothetical protein